MTAILDRIRSAAESQQNFAQQAYLSLIDDIATGVPVDDSTALEILTAAGKSPDALDAAVQRHREAAKVSGLIERLQAAVDAVPQARRDLQANRDAFAKVQAAHDADCAPLLAKISAGESAGIRLMSERNKLSLLTR